MLKHKYVLAAALTGTSLLVSGVSAAAKTPDSFEQLKQNGIYVIDSREDLVQLNEKLAQLGMNPSNKVLIEQILINCDFSGIPEENLPDLPDVDFPDGDIPEVPAPDVPEQPTPENPDPDVPDRPEIPDQPETPDQDTDSHSYAMQVISLVNQERAKEGLPALEYDAAIEKAALVRAKETEESFSHTRPNGTSFSTALTENGVSYRGAGENIAWGQKSPEEVMNGWMNSPGHRANILNKNFTKIGVGYYQNHKGVNYWTQLFTS